MRITFSQLPRVFKCPASAALPQVYSSSPFAERGTVGHKYLEQIPSLGAAQALANVPDKYREEMGLMDVSGIHVGPEWRQEVPLAINTETAVGRILPGTRNRRYSTMSEMEIAGTADVVGVFPNLVHIIDYKFGYSELGRVEENPQLLAAALAMSDLRSVYNATVEILYMRTDGNFSDSYILGLEELTEFARQLKENINLARTADLLVKDGRTPDLREGEHCKWCPAFASCPAKTSAIARMVTNELTNENISTAITKQNVAEAYARLLKAEQVLEWIRARVEEIARREPVQLPDGRVYGERTTSREVFDTDTAFVAIGAMGGLYANAAVKAFGGSVTKAGLARAAKELGVDEQTLMDKVRQAGASKTVPSKRLGTFRPDVVE